MVAVGSGPGCRMHRAPKPVVVRNRVNQWASLIMGAGLVVLAIPVMDAMHVWSVFSDAPDETWLEALPWYLGFAAGGMAFVIFGARPRVEIDDRQVVIRNVLRDVYIPRANLREIDDESGTYLGIVSTQGRYRCWGGERFNYEVVASRPGPGGRALADVAVLHPGREGEMDVVVWRKPEWYELAFLAIWVAYPVVALFT